MKQGETTSGCWTLKVGEHGSVVKARERTRGGRVQLHWADPGTGKRLSRYAATENVRDRRGRLMQRACDAVAREAEELATRLKVARLDASIEPTRLTVEQGFARYHDPDRGNLPESKTARKHHHDARLFWLDRLGASTPWNRVPPADVDAGLKALKVAGHVPTAEKYLRCLRTVYRWLRDRAGYEGLRDPTYGVDLKKLRQGYQVRQPRYTLDELAALIKVADRVDPRFRFALLWARDSGARSVALYRAMRSHVDAPLDLPPDPDMAPYGWAALPAVKGQDRALTFLTLIQRLEFVRATWRRWNGVQWVPGYLSDLEVQWQLNGTDYPLIPGGIIPRTGVIRPGRLSPVVNMTLINWLRDAEREAGVDHVERRAWHGVRRAWADWTAAATSLDTVVAAGAWADRETPERIYLERIKFGRLDESRRAQEDRDDA